MADMTEKRTRQLPALRIGETLETSLMRLAARDERSLSDYVFRVLFKHVYGHGISLDDEDGQGNTSRASLCRSIGEGT